MNSWTTILFTDSKALLQHLILILTHLLKNPNFWVCAEWRGCLQSTKINLVLNLIVPDD